MIDAKLKTYKSKDVTEIRVRNCHDYIILVDRLQLLKEKFPIGKTGAYLCSKSVEYRYYVIFYNLDKVDLKLLEGVIKSL